MCSTWLASLEPEKCTLINSDIINIDFKSGYSCSAVIRVPVWVVPGTIRFPRKPDSHVIMIGPGTGCAPFRTYIEERAEDKAEGEH